jgi:hypothetical protein
LFFLSLILLIDKGGVGRLYIYRMGVYLLHLTPPEVTCSPSQGFRRMYIIVVNYSYYQNITRHLVLIYTVTSVSAGLCSSLCLNLLNLQKRQSDTWTVIDLTAAKFKPNMFLMPGFSLSNCKYICTRIFVI